MKGLRVFQLLLGVAICYAVFFPEQQVWVCELGSGSLTLEVEGERRDISPYAPLYGEELIVRKYLFHPGYIVSGYDSACAFPQPQQLVCDEEARRLRLDTATGVAAFVSTSVRHGRQETLLKQGWQCRNTGYRAGY